MGYIVNGIEITEKWTHINGKTYYRGSVEWVEVVYRKDRKHKTSQYVSFEEYNNNVHRHLANGWITIHVSTRRGD